MSARNGIFAGEDPFIIARRWLDDAEAVEPNDAKAIALATVVADGLPDVRMVLLKEIESFGAGAGAFVFYTNYESRKGGELAVNGRAAMLFFWSELHRQVRIEGTITKVSHEETERYFHSHASNYPSPGIAG